MSTKREDLIESIKKRVGSDFLVKKEVQILLSISSASLNRMLSNSEISYTKLTSKKGASVRFLVEDIVDMLLSNYVTAYHINN